MVSLKPLYYNTFIHLMVSFKTGMQSILANSVWLLTLDQMLMTLFHRENILTPSLNYLQVRHSKRSVTFAAYTLMSGFWDVCTFAMGRVKDNHHGHNIWTFNKLRKPKNTERSGLALTSYFSYKLQWWQPAGLFASWTTNRWGKKLKTEHSYEGRSMYKYHPKQLLTKRIS